MTKEEMAVASAFTGVMFGDFEDMHEYIEKILERPVFIHELAAKSICDEVKKKSTADFMRLFAKASDK